MNHDKLAELAHSILEYEDVKEIICHLQHAINDRVDLLEMLDKREKTTEFERKCNKIREINLEHLCDELDEMSFFVMPKE